MVRAAAVGLFAVFAAALSVAAPAAEPPASPETSPVLLSGRIVAVRGGQIEVVPWDPARPKRLVIALTPEAVIVRQRLTRLQSSWLGDAVLALVAHPPARAASAASPAAPPGTAAPVAEPLLRTHVLLRLAPGVPASAAAQAAYLRACRGYFTSERRGGRRKPPSGSRTLSGTLASLKPLTLRKAGGDDQLLDSRGVTVVDHTLKPLESLSRGETVLARCLPSPDQGGPMLAELLVQGPAPLLGGKTRRRLILREQRPLDPGTGGRLPSAESE
jgi:hypothetical protein